GPTRLKGSTPQKMNETAMRPRMTATTQRPNPSRIACSMASPKRQKGSEPFHAPRRPSENGPRGHQRAPTPHRFRPRADGASGPFTILEKQRTDSFPAPAGKKSVLRQKNWRSGRDSNPRPPA